MTRCPTCGDEYDRLAQHWAVGACECPSVPDGWIETITGVLMGDGTIHRPDSARNARRQVTNVSRSFLEWLDERLDRSSTGVSLWRTSAEIAEENARSSHERFSSLAYDGRDQYVLSTRRHPVLNQFVSWYDDGDRRFPHDLEPTPYILKQWCVCDGSPPWGTAGHQRPSLRMSCPNAADRPSRVAAPFEDTPLSPSINEERITFNADEAETFLDYVGSGQTGYDDKFVTERRAAYRTAKETFYRTRTTTTDQ
ncbi:MAG: hypothetical protein ABEJ61_06485 [Haloferacaceae archaeon]